jgi:DNA-binding NtrC family response regulator
MDTQNSLTCRLAFLGEGADELDSLRSVSDQLTADTSAVYSTKQAREFRKFEPEYCVLYPAAASDEVVKSLVSEAVACPRAPKIILLLAQLNTVRLEKELEAMGARRQVIHLEQPDASRAAELIKSFLIKEQCIAPPFAGWEFVGATALVHKLYESIKSFARWDKDPVLIVGETGTGKELIARRLHELSGREHFRPYNAAAIPLDLLESLLFGHVKGSFTGAVYDTEGYIQKAEDGTLFIDEIGDVHPAIQVKLLRTIQERKVFKLGEDESKAKFTNARFVFATNRNLKDACRSGNFREDLFHRISALQIDVPPLRERKADIPLLIEHFVKEFVKDYTEDTTDAEADDAREPAVNIYTDNLFKLGALFDYDWKGNVRELRNVVRQAAAMTGAGPIDRWLAELVGKKLEEQKEERKLQTSAPQVSQRLNELGSFMNSLLDSTWKEADDEFKKAYWQAAFLKTNGQRDAIMSHAGIAKTTFYDFKHFTEPPEFTAEDLTDAARLAIRLKGQADPVSTYVRGHLTSRTRLMLKEYVESEPVESLRGALAKELNQLLKDQNLYQAERFREVHLTENTRDLIEHQGLHKDLFRLNRMLLEDAYPNEIRKKQLSPEAGKKERSDDSEPESASQLKPA